MMFDSPEDEDEEDSSASSSLSMNWPLLRRGLTGYSCFLRFLEGGEAETCPFISFAMSSSMLIYTCFLFSFFYFER